jgi:hypothetical protein
MTGMSNSLRPHMNAPVNRLARLAFAAVLVSSGCAQTPAGPAKPSGSTAAVASDSACPPAQPRFLTCGNGVRLVTYDDRLQLPRYCDPIATIEQTLRGFDRSRPIQRLSDGTRAMISGAAGWLLLPKEAELIEAPAAVTVWWRNRQCTFPSGLKAYVPSPGASVGAAPVADLPANPTAVAAPASTAK